MPVDTRSERTASVIPVRRGGMHQVIDRPDRHLPTLVRVRSYCQRVRRQSSLAQGLTALLRERARAMRMDAGEWLSHAPRITRVLPGADALAPSGSTAIYVHYAPTPRVSAMVLAQLRSYRALGFRILFVSMAPPLPAATLEQLAECVALVVQRRNVGLDFGAWQDMVPFLSTGLAGTNELLLVNDSVCGPLRPLHPILADMRAHGDGFYGMTESLAPTPHLQSYFLLARGDAAVGDVIDFLIGYRQTNYKRHVVQLGEIRLSHWMRARGHAVRASFGYQRTEATALRSPLARHRLRHLFPHLFAAIEDQGDDFARCLQRHPLNPTHALWRELVEELGFPFLKTDLLLANPAGVSDLEAWPSLVQSQQQMPEITAHLALMHQGRPRS